MKKHAIALILILMSTYSSAQVTNNAIDFERNGRISLGVIRNCTTTSGTTLQLWFNPQHWIPGANIATWGQSLSIQLGTPGKLVVKNNNEEFTFSDTNISAGTWTHITLLLDGSNSLIALGATNVDVNMKKINKRKTKSDIDDELKSIFLLFLDFIAIITFI